MYNQLIGQFLAAVQSSSADMDRVAAQESTLFPHATRPAARPRSCESQLRYRRAFLKRMTANLVDKASLQLGHRVDETRICLDGPHNVWQVIDAGDIPDLDRLWHELLGRAAQPVAVHHAAELLREAFADNSVLGMRMTREAGILRLAAASEPAAGQPHGLRWLRAGAIERARMVVTSLAVFAKDAGELPLAACLQAFRVDASFAPTQRRPFPGAEIRQFKEYWEIRLRRDLAVRLAQFVGH